MSTDTQAPQITISKRHSCPMFPPLSTLSTKPRSGNSPSAQEQMLDKETGLFTHNVILFRYKDSIIFLSTWVDLDAIMPSEVSQKD